MDLLVQPEGQVIIEIVDFNDGTAPKKAETVLSACKMMATFFWALLYVTYNVGCRSYIDYLKKNSTMPNRRKNWTHLA